MLNQNHQEKITNSLKKLYFFLECLFINKVDIISNYGKQYFDELKEQLIINIKYLELKKNDISDEKFLIYIESMTKQLDKIEEEICPKFF